MDNQRLQALKALSIRTDALRRAMETVMNGSTPDHAKWGAFGHYVRAYNELIKKYGSLMGETIKYYNEEKMGNWSNTVWPFQKTIFDSVYADVIMLSAMLAEYDTGASASASGIQDLLIANLRKIIFSKPDREIDVQNAIEALLIGRGYQKGINYDRESGKLKFSGKEFIPDFVFKPIDTVLEVKLIAGSQKVSSCVEEICADIPAYLSSYSRVIFCVYDLGFIRDVVEFQNGIQNQNGVRICVVKH